jgi:hypothetical protein
MNQWAFVVAAYGVTAAGTAIMSFVSWRTMRRAETAAEVLPGRA